MKLEDQVVSLELAKRLKELGVKQESYFAYVNIKQGGIPHVLRPLGRFVGVENYVSAYTVAELGEMLPGSVRGYYSGNPASAKLFHFEEWKGVFDFTVQYKGANEVLHWITDNSEANARTKMLIYLLENNLITL